MDWGLAAVRGEAIQKWPEAERGDWLRLWAEVDAALREAEEHQ